jgi:hypothetical protein
MFRIQPPIVIIPTTEVRAAAGIRLREIANVAYREIALASKGLEIAHLQFEFSNLTLAVCSRVRRDGAVEIEIGMGDPRLPASCFTAALLRQADARVRVGPNWRARSSAWRVTTARASKPR